MKLKVGDFIQLRCPICSKGKIFHGYLDTPNRCENCGYYFMRETGYFLPHAPISYLVIVAAAAVTWVVVRLILRFESDAIVLPSLVIFPLLFGWWSNRYTKMAWMAIDLYLHPPTKEDFEERGRV
jgi:uncharacterized protein (DUF983 family)